LLLLLGFGSSVQERHVEWSFLQDQLSGLQSVAFGRAVGLEQLSRSHPHDSSFARAGSSAAADARQSRPDAHSQVYTGFGQKGEALLKVGSLFASACATFNLKAILAIVRHPSCAPDVIALPDHRGRTCLHVLGAARDNQPPVNPDYNPIYEGLKVFFFFFFVCLQHIVVDAILEKCPQLVSQPDAEGNTPLHSSSAAGNRSVLRSLLTSNLCEEWTIAIENKQGQTARQVRRKRKVSPFFSFRDE